ncbi:hypothetical protein BMS3Abin16_00799 [archaeon BMS3Abin16]|nr:hypothetical protein BMS3Abin16_00799 [archaeon BMS3Abin16]GBE55831.1 hypothetical protein BMS3Bbin16_00026 [archaeon BMS3Bbin16]
MEVSNLPPVAQSALVLLSFVALFILASWLLGFINKISSENE